MFNWKRNKVKKTKLIAQAKNRLSNLVMMGLIAFLCLVWPAYSFGNCTTHYDCCDTDEITTTGRTTNNVEEQYTYVGPLAANCGYFWDFSGNYYTETVSNFRQLAANEIVVGVTSESQSGTTGLKTDCYLGPIQQYGCSYATEWIFIDTYGGG
jgi:hypothetical protein